MNQLTQKPLHPYADKTTAAVMSTKPPRLWSRHRPGANIAPPGGKRHYPEANGAHNDWRTDPAVNGYGVIGRRVAAAVALQADMTLVRERPGDEPAASCRAVA